MMFFKCIIGYILACKRIVAAVCQSIWIMVRCHDEHGLLQLSGFIQLVDQIL